MNTLSEKALLVTLSLSKFEPKKTDKRITHKVTMETGAATGMLRVGKQLLPDQAVEPIRKLHGEIREFHYAHTLPWGENNERLLASAYFMEYQERMAKFRMEDDRLVEEFVRDYPGNVETARSQLNGAFNATDYPAVDMVKHKFGFRLEYKPVPDAGDFRISVVREAMDDLRRSVNERVAEAEQAARRDLATRLAKPLARMVERLNDPDAEFRDTLVSNVRDICDLVPVLNITGDPVLDAVRTELQASLYHASPDTLRENPTVRAHTARAAQGILDKMGDYFGAVETAEQSV